ncbi:VanW family protein [Bacillus sp. AGMB 02131]|uniref:VanW family protein n=1 Tax=Peribacillus faecalis TaxID=2772559 RepID=A0A927HAU9_9BACI|nr:VanW family protein [Peribacillus faecalis]MBD3108324.1 VanW family protein [Peribacillus faecalis]
MKKFLIWLLSIISVILIAAGSVFLYFHDTVSQYENRFYPNIVIEGRNLSGLTKEEALNQLDNIINQYNQINVTITAGDQVFQKQLQDLGVQYDLDKQVEEAFQFGKNENILEQYNLIKNEQGQSYTLSYSIDDMLLDNWISEIGQSLERKPLNATMKINNGQVSITNDVSGLQIDQEQLKTSLSDALNSNQKQDIAAIANLEEIRPDITYDALSNVRYVIGSYTTNYSSNQANRNTNIKIATETIDSYLLMPGESFSFNDYIGDTTADKGYRPAGTYLNGQVVDSLGGGVCQVSTTLYNAIIKAGIIPDTRYNHSMTVGYVPIGQDAAIAYPYKDLAFTNPYDAPIYIEGTVTPTSVTFTIYSTADSKDSNIEYKLSSKTLNSTNKNIISETYLETYINGSLTESKIINRDTYKVN